MAVHLVPETSEDCHNDCSWYPSGFVWMAEIRDAMAVFQEEQTTCFSNGLSFSPTSSS
jgi:hypothetical protein